MTGTQHSLYRRGFQVQAKYTPSSSSSSSSRQPIAMNLHDTVVIWLVLSCPLRSCLTSVVFHARTSGPCRQCARCFSRKRRRKKEKEKKIEKFCKCACRQQWPSAHTDQERGALFLFHFVFFSRHSSLTVLFCFNIKEIEATISACAFFFLLFSFLHFTFYWTSCARGADFFTADTHSRRELYCSNTLHSIVDRFVYFIRSLSIYNVSGYTMCVSGPTWERARAFGVSEWNELERRRRRWRIAFSYFPFSISS